ncbi:cupin domain-containing protein [Spirosoma rhododendri]|uniref:Cupin domain-containing protein n=1 Tax=Spirosoma rhododendri TaxID=2728024 RepID=A0A7L5DUG4_9BACT|nr:cupin domain-containing protein [Spirosoma rhododendri]QJD79607.1 cupin domain-containing protein [Spirosoma rhododendri]
MNQPLSLATGLLALQRHSAEFINLFAHGSLVVDFYKPDRVDKQPHPRHEVYIITNGTGTFDPAGCQMAVKPGDLLVVPAGTDHRFRHFPDDFATWVLFYGPDGGKEA